MIFWAVRNAMIGVAIGLVAVVVYSNTRTASGPDEQSIASESSRAAGAVRDRSTPRRSMTIRAGRGGHYLLDARINGRTVRFVVDTGATRIVLRREDAKRVGLHVRDHHFTERAHTANGVVRAAPVVLRNLQVGSFMLRNVEAAVNGGPLFQSLLGMDFLRRLDGYEVSDGKLILYW